MRFPKAYKGIKKLIVAQAMMLITEIVAVVITFVLSDYYDFLEGDKAAIRSFSGEFMSQYSWAEEATSFLEQKALKKD